MYIIIAVICFMQIGSLKQDLCFTSEVPLEFKDVAECSSEMHNISNYMDKDLKEKNVSISFFCKEKITPINI